VPAGGVALNCVERRLLREGPFRQIWIQPAAVMRVAPWAWHS